MKPETVISANMAMTTSSAQVTDISSRKVYYVQESPAVLSTTTNSGGINAIKDSHNEFIMNYVDSKNYEHISDATSSTEADDTKGDGNNAWISENTRSSGNLTLSTQDPDSIRTADIDTGPTDSAYQVYQTNISPVEHPWTVGLCQFHQEERPGHIEQPESTSLGDEPQKKQVHRSSHRSASRMHQTRNNHRVHLQHQEPAPRNILPEADRQRNSRKRSNMRRTLSLHRHGDTHHRKIHTTLQNSLNIWEKLLDSTIREKTIPMTYGIT